MDNLRGFKDAANDAGISFKTYFIEAETTREEIQEYLAQHISEYKKTLVYASDVEALRKGYLGIKLDKKTNDVRGVEEIISTPDSKVTVCVIPTNEELAICRETVALVK